MKFSWAIALFLVALSLPVAAQPDLASEQGCVETEQRARQTIRTSPTMPDGYLDLGDALVCLNRGAEAIAPYQQVIDQFQQNPEMQWWVVSAAFKLAPLQVQQNQLEQALSTYQQAVHLDPIYGFLVGLFDARQYSPLGEPVTDGGVRGDAYGAAVEADTSTEASAYYELGQTLATQTRWPEAIAAYRQAITLSPTFAYAYLALGQALYQQNQPEAAIASYQEALRLNPELVWGHYALGQVLAQQDRTEEAIAAFRRVIGFHTGMDTFGEDVKENIAYSLLGDVRREQGNLAGAAAAYREAIAQYPPEGFTRIRLGQVLLEQSLPEEAITAFQDALVQLPEPATSARALAYVGLGQALMQQERREEAIAAFQSALSLDPGAVEAQEQLQQLAVSP